MFVFAHARLLVLHNPLSGKVAFFGGVDLVSEQSAPMYELKHLHWPLNKITF